MDRPKSEIHPEVDDKGETWIVARLTLGDAHLIGFVLRVEAGERWESNDGSKELDDLIDRLNAAFSLDAIKDGSQPEDSNG